MIRLLAALGVFLFSAMWFLGADHGQYINPPRQKTAEMAQTAPAKRSVFIPAQPREEAAAEVTPAAAAPPEPPLSTPPAEPDLNAITVRPMRAPAGATVHTGPGIEFPVWGMVRAGGVVMAAAQAEAPGWIRIVVDGGGFGWVSAKLLRE
ncbi:hypothetical protein GC209_00030 [bacterium]|nr:hypothetical protein [bacterium]